MKPRKIILLALAIVVILLIGFVFITYALDIGAKAIDLKVDEYMSELVKQKRFSGSILIAKDGKPIVERSYGMANIADKIPNALQTRFRIGPITDQLKAAAIMKLCLQDKLNLSDEISEYLDDCPDAWKSITIQDLLNQSSGIPDYMRFPNIMEISSQKKITPAAIVSLFKDKPLEIISGTRTQYSNSNYLLLSLIIEKVSGMSYMDFMQKTIFKPFRMKNTGFAGYGEIIKNQAAGYELKENEFNKTILQDIFPYSVSSIYSTVEDLLIWDQSLYLNKLLPHRSLNAVLFPSYARGYVNGSIIDNFYKRIIFNSGGIPGFSSHYAHFPDENICIIIFSNLDIKSFPFKTTILDLSAIIFGEKYELPKESKFVKIDPAICDGYAGEYQLGPYPGLGKLIFTVTSESNKLIIKDPEQAKFELLPVSETNFYSNETEIECEFIKDSTGHITLMVLHNAGRETPLKVNKKEIPGPKSKIQEKDLEKKLNSHGFNPDEIMKLIRLIEDGTYSNVHSLIVMRSGDLLVEKYFNGYNAGNAHTLQSVSKSFTSALIGIALEKGYLKSLDQKILSFFPQYKAIENLDDKKKMIDIEDLLTMRSGVDYWEGGPGSGSVHDKLNELLSGWDRFYLNRPMLAKPGTRFNYDSGGVILLSAILKSVSGVHADIFADKWLFPKLGITGIYWVKNRENHPHTGGGLYMKPIDMAKFGQLYLMKGIWNGEQVIPANWVEESFRMHVDLTNKIDPYTKGYGYLWWILKPGKEKEGKDPQYIYTARGFMGQRIFVAPEYDMVVVVTAGAITQEEEMCGETILYKHIIPAIRK